MKFKTLLTLALTIVLFSGCAVFQKKKKNNKVVATESTASKKTKEGIQPFDKVITKEAISDKGLFTVHKIKDKYFYEIPDTLLKKDMLWVSRIAQIPQGLGGGYVNAGSKTNEQVVHWTRFNDKILLKIKSYTSVADSTKPLVNL